MIDWIYGDVALTGYMMTGIDWIYGDVACAQKLNTMGLKLWSKVWWKVRKT